MKHIISILLSLTLCTPLLAQHANTIVQQFKVTVKQEGWHIVKGAKCMRVMATIQNISGHRLAYLQSDFDAHIFCTDTAAAYVYNGRVGCGKTKFSFPSLMAGASAKFPVDIAVADSTRHTIKFRLGFIWTIPNGKTGYDFLKSFQDDPPKQKTFWSDTLTITR